MNINDLVQDSTLWVASLPPGNEDVRSTSGPVTVPIIAEDYPAKTAVMWNAVYRKIGLPDRNSMLVGDPQDVKRVLKAFREDERYRGGGAGIGFKEGVLPLLDELTPLAKAMGSVNIIKKTATGSLIGDNTDGVGYAESLEEKLLQSGRSLSETQIVILGAGGTGRSIGFALASKGAQLSILNRTEEKAVALAQEINTYVGKHVASGGGRSRIVQRLPRVDAVISVVDDATSPLDEYSPLTEMPLPITLESIEKNRKETAQLLARAKPGLVVSDIRIRKTETPMLAEARLQGMQTLDGIPMVVNQGIAAFWWIYEDILQKKGLTRKDLAKIMRDAAM